MTPATGHTPRRTDAGAREVRDRDELVRWFVGPDGTPWPDWTGRSKRLGGRSAWTRPTVAAVRAAVRQGGFQRAFRGQVGRMDVDTLVARMVEQGRRAFFDRLGLACRAGELGIGQAAATEALAKRPGLVILAADAGPSGSRKFTQQARRKGVPMLTAAQGEDLGAALGREFVSVVVVARSVFSDDLGRWGKWLSGLDETGINEYEDPGSASAGIEDRSDRSNTETPATGH